MARTICLVSPGNLASNPRLVKEADALHGAGYDVTVVACNYSAELRSMDDEIEARVPWTVVRVPRPLGEGAITIAAYRLARVLARAGAPVPAELAARAAGGPVSTLRRAARRVRADLYIAHYVAGLAAVAPVARRRGAMLGFDGEDFHSGESPARADRDFRMKVIETVEQAALPSCAYATASSPMIAQAYAARYGIDPTTVLNVFPLDMAPAAPQPSDPTRLKAYWFSQTIGLDRGLQPFLQAMARTRSDVTLDIRGGNQWGAGDGLMALARELGIADRVAILPKTTPDEMVRLAAAYDIGLSLETTGTLNHRICLTNKLFTYLLAGIPAMMSDTPAQREFARGLGASGIVVSLEDPGTIAAALDELGEAPARLAEAKRTAWRLGHERYNWDVEKDFLLKAVDRAFTLRGPGKAVR